VEEEWRQSGGGVEAEWRMYRYDTGMTYVTSGVEGDVKRG